MSDYPDEVQRLHDALRRLDGVTDVDLGVRSLEGLDEQVLSLPGEFGDLPHAVLRQARGTPERAVLVTAEVRFSQDHAGWVALELLAWWVRDLSRSGHWVQMRPLALPPVAYGTQLGRTLKFVLEFFFARPEGDLTPVLREVGELADSLSQCLELYAEALARPTRAHHDDLDSLRRSAEANDAAAQFELAQRYEQGEGVEQDEAEAFRWYERAAGNNYPPGLLHLGVCHADGTGTMADPVAAVRCYREAAEAGLPLAMGLLGQCYEEGRGVGRDEAEAVRWYRQGADAGEVHCAAQVGECYEYGRGVERDLAEALRWYERALEGGLDDVEPAIQRVRQALEEAG